MTGPVLRLAWRELRGGVRGFRIFIACLALGVGAVAAIGSTARAILDGLQAEGRETLGGDVAVRSLHRDLPPEARRWLDDNAAAVTRSVSMRAMARAADGRGRSLIELKAVDGRYPLYGALRLAAARPGLDPFARIDGVWGAAVAPPLLERLGAAPGARIRIGEAVFEIRAAIEREPDRLGDGGLIGFGPRVLVSTASLADAGLIRPGSLARFRYRAKLDPGADPAAFRRTFADRFPESGWRVRDRTNAAPATGRLVERTEAFMTLIGLAALLVGGVGVGNAVAHFLRSRAATIAALKCLGASSGTIFGVYLVQILAMSAAGVALGLAVGAAAPFAAGEAVGAALGVSGRFGVHPGALGLAAGYGLLTALVFSLWPLARACRIPGAALFRDLVAAARTAPGPAHAAALAACAASLAGLVLASARDLGLALWFVVGAAASFALFRLVGLAIERGAACARGATNPVVRLALANLHRPGALTSMVVLSLGLGLTALVAIVSIEGNLRDRIARALPERAPDFYVVDLQPDQLAGFEDAVRRRDGGAEIEHVPMLRGRIVAIDGAPAVESALAPSDRWLLRGDRGVTWSAAPPDGTRILAGRWWAPGYRGAPLISLSAGAAEGLGVGVGDSLTVNVLGREVTGTIANVREVRWRSLRINFVMVFSPGPFDAAPQIRLAALRAAPEALDGIEREVTDRFTNVSVVRVSEMLALVADVVARVGAAVRAAAAVTLLAGVLVLAGAAASGHRRRVHDAVVLKVLGATRGRVLAAYTIEYGLLGLAAAAVATGLGALAAWAAARYAMEMDWSFDPAVAAATALAATALTLAFGFLGAWRALGRKAAPVLRND